MINADDLYRRLDEIRTAIEENTRPDGVCQFDAEVTMITLNLALRCVKENEPE